MPRAVARPKKKATRVSKTRKSAVGAVGPIVRVRAFGAQQLVKVRGGYELRIFQDIKQGVWLGVYPAERAPGSMPYSGGCWSVPTKTGDVKGMKCAGAEGCKVWELVLDKAAGQYKWEKRNFDKVDDLSTGMSFICGCSDPPY